MPRLNFKICVEIDVFGDVLPPHNWVVPCLDSLTIQCVSMII